MSKIRIFDGLEPYNIYDEKPATIAIKLADVQAMYLTSGTKCSQSGKIHPPHVCIVLSCGVIFNLSVQYDLDSLLKWWKNEK
jgi:hypothetical protein